MSRRSGRNGLVATAARVAALSVGVLGLPLLTGWATTAASASTAAASTTAASGCTDNWTNTSGGSWDTGTNWSTGSAPTSSDVACITVAGTYTVVLGNEAVTLAGLVVGAPGAHATLQIGNGGSGEPAITTTGTVTVAATGTLSDGWGGTFTAATVNDAGTFVIPSTGYTSSVAVTTFADSGQFTVDGGLLYSLPTSGSTLDNTGTLSVASGVTLAVTSPSGQSGTLDQSGVIDDSGVLTVADALVVSGGSVCGNAPFIGAGDGGAGGTLTFATTVAAGPACPTGQTTDAVFVPNVTATISGHVPSAYTVTIGDGGPSEPSVTLAGVANAGTLSFGWGGTLTGALTNTGTFTVPATGFTSSWTTTGFDNTGTAAINGILALTLSASDSTLTNGGTLSVAAGGILTVASPSGQTGSFVEDGLLTNLGVLTVADALQVNGGSICGNAVYSGSGDAGTAGTLSFATKLAKGPACAAGQAVDHIFIPNVTGTIATDVPAHWYVGIGDGGSGFAHVTFLGSVNAGTLSPGFGATLTDTNPVTNTGTILVRASGYTTNLNLGGLTNDGTVTLDGATSVTLPAGQTLTSAAKKKVTLGAGVALNVNQSVSNAGTLTVDAGATLTTAGSFDQAGTGALTVQVGSASAAPRIAASGPATVAGAIDVTTKKYKPTNGQAFTMVQGSALTGTFSPVHGSYTISYTPTSVVATAS